MADLSDSQRHADDAAHVALLNLTNKRIDFDSHYRAKHLDWISDALVRRITEADQFAAAVRAVLDDQPEQPEQQPDERLGDSDSYHQWITLDRAEYDRLSIIAERIAHVERCVNGRDIDDLSGTNARYYLTVALGR